MKLLFIGLLVFVTITTSFKNQVKHKLPYFLHGKKSDSNKQVITIEIGEEGLTYEETGRQVKFLASRECTSSVKKPGPESKRTLRRYLALPPEMYSLLDGSTNLKRLSETEFVAEVDPISFLGNTIIPKLFATVVVDDFPSGVASISVTKCELGGGRLANFANGQFELECTNRVFAVGDDVLGVKCTIDINAKVPKEGRWLPLVVLRKSGNLVMRGALNLMLPRFLKSLVEDYENWSISDDASRWVE